MCLIAAVKALLCSNFLGTKNALLNFTPRLHGVQSLTRSMSNAKSILKACYVVSNTSNVILNFKVKMQSFYATFWFAIDISLDLIIIKLKPINLTTRVVNLVRFLINSKTLLFKTNSQLCKMDIDGKSDCCQFSHWFFALCKSHKVTTLRHCKVHIKFLHQPSNKLDHSKTSRSMSEIMQKKNSIKKLHIKVMKLITMGKRLKKTKEHRLSRPRTEAHVQQRSYLKT